MKKIIALVFTIFSSFLLVAQESEAVHGPANWSDATKTYWLISIVALSVFLAARTFRDKPDA